MKKNLETESNNNKIFQVSFLLVILIFSPIVGIFRYSNAQFSRDIDNYNHFQMTNILNVSGQVRYIEISPDLSSIITRTSNVGSLIRTSDFMILCNFSTTFHNGLDWNPKSNEFADGNFIRNKSDCRPRDILYGESISWNKDGRIATISYPTLNIWNDTNISLIYKRSDKNYSAVAWDKSGKYISLTENSKVDILNANNLSFNRSISMESDETTGINSEIAWSPDSKFIAYSSNEYFIQLINVDNGTIIKKLYGFTSSVTSFAWSRDGNYIVAGSLDKTVNLYDLRNDTTYTLHLDGKIATDVIFGIDFHNIIIGTNIGTIELWKFDKDILKAEAGPDLSGIVGQILSFSGSNSEGEIRDDGFSWIISNLSGTIATLSGKVTSYSFLQPGNYRLMLIVKDINGKESEDYTNVHIFTPSNKPTVTITFPTNNAEISGSVIFTGTANDDIMVRKVEVQINDGGWQKADGTTDWQFKFDSRNYRDGAYVLNVRAYDDTLISDIVYTTFGINNVKHTPPNDPPPTITILEPLNGSMVKGIITIRGTAEDNTYISEIDVQLPSYYCNAIGGKNWFLNFNTKDVPDGKWIITAEAYDEFHQKGTATIIILINNTGIGSNARPQIGIIYPLNNTNITGLIDFKGWASDDKELKIVQFRINDSLWYTCDGLASWHYEINSSKYKNGPFLIKVRAFDGHLFSTNATIVVRIINQENGTHNNNPPEPQNQDTYNISYAFIVIIIIIITLLIYIAYMAKKLRIILTIVIIILLIAIIYIWPIIPNHQNNNNNQPSNDGGSHEPMSNCTLAADFTFMSLKDGRIISNEKELGRVVFLYFTWEWGNDPYFATLKDLTKFYKDSNGTYRLHIIVFNVNEYISETAFNQTMRNIDPSWDYQKDNLGSIRGNLGQTNLGKGWIIIDKKECMKSNDIEKNFDMDYFKGIINPLIT